MSIASISPPLHVSPAAPSDLTAIPTPIALPRAGDCRDGCNTTGSADRKEGGNYEGGAQLPNCFFRPSLVDLAMRVVAANFLRFPSFGNMSADCRLAVVALLDLDLPLDMCAQLIYEEEYWERRSHAQWKNCDITAHGRSWKQLFFERHLAGALESFDPTSTDENALKRLLEISAPFVHNLCIHQLPSHLSAAFIFHEIARGLRSLKLEFGCQNAGMKYDKKQFGMRLSDCRSLSATFSIALTLAELDLSCNDLNDEKVCILVEGMLKSPSVVYLNLSHNCFSNSGVAELCKLWNSENSVLAVLNVCNNAISVDGAKIIGESLRDNEVLVSLNLRHNPIEDDGGEAIFDALQSNMTMQRLCVSACGVGERTAASVQRLLQNPKSGLIALDISANRYIGVTGGFAIYSGLESSKIMKEVNVQLSDCGSDVEVAINKVLLQRCIFKTPLCTKKDGSLKDSSIPK